ncbi:hypothetical protein ES692_08140 [Psychroserpens burtonensis]|uniref:Carboxypeptidase regulatory-like domain-containing protein n=1 Tax=Psychroserpens burtonensis TaxID=49278 RepID=A0A5C7B774_9FLAO|nr:hypothetical protein [Psychroserpens burtonensis]TXE17859.1 hypothetical protein ES692_08140 [Psychroserpens burtonensis]
MNTTIIKKTASKLVCYIFCVLYFNISFSQDKRDVQPSYDKYINLPREIAFARLNKSLYLKGETIGFSVYVIDKTTKKPSTKTTNVYTVITDGNNKTIKEQLIWAKEGKAIGTFSIDSTFTKGNYTFKAYTNWMKNFDEQNLYAQSIKIIDPDIPDNDEIKTISSKLDAQFLPEGGHLVSDTENTIGVVIKDTLGYGVPNITGRILNDNNIVVSTFKTNQVGLGKFLFIHESKTSYTVELDFRNRIQTFDLNTIEKRGVNITLNQIDSKIALTFRTNKETLPTIKDKPYTLFIHNGSQSKTIPITFKNSTTLVKAIAFKNLFSGINILTLFNENNVPILERLFFNRNEVELLETVDAFVEKYQDSIAIQVPLSGMKPLDIARLSISILPNDTKSYNADHNILSHILVQPYIKSNIENAKYYFIDNDSKKEYDLDNLLLTQGWSSYDWNTIFNTPPKQVYLFETGISFIGNSTYSDKGRFILHSSKHHDALAFIVDEKESSFSHSNYFIEDNNPLEFSQVTGKTTMQKPSLHLQFSPSKVPNIKNFINVLPLKENTVFEANGSDTVFDTKWNTVEQLDEVLIEANIEKRRINKLITYYSTGKLDMFDDEQRIHEIDMMTYLNKQGYIVLMLPNGKMELTILRFGKREIPKIYLNNQVLMDIDVLLNFNMSDIDYVALDKTIKQYDASNVGNGGTIHINTNPGLRFKNDTRKGFNQKVSLPLTFTSPKTFYAPKYVNYDSNFFREYGVIDWIPNITLDKTNAINLKILDTKTKQIKLCIEGVTNEGRFISEEKVITIN